MNRITQPVVVVAVVVDSSTAGSVVVTGDVVVAMTTLTPERELNVELNKTDG